MKNDKQQNNGEPYKDDFVFSYNEEDDYEKMVDISAENAEIENDDTIIINESYNNDSNKYKRKISNKKIIAVISAAAAVVVIALGITGISMWRNNAVQTGARPQDFTFADGTVVSGISISGKTMEQAKKLLESKEDSFVKPVNISVDANGEVTNLTEKDFDYTYNIEEVLSIIKNEAKNPSSKSTTKTYEISAEFTAESVEKNAKAIEEKTDKEAVNASVSKFTPYSKNRFEYTEAKKGCKLDGEDLKQQITQAMESNVIECRIIADVKDVEAKIHTDDIKKNVKKLASYQTVSYNTANGTSNMKVALEACNGSVIEPGETWSFNGCTGDSNLESKGYKAAHVISEGKLVDGIGGGICQASSTIYNAAVRANMDIEERSNHKWASAYVPTGLDATIDYPRLDLKLSNPTDYQMFIECKVVDSTLYVSIWGCKSSSYDTIKTHNELTSRGGDSYTVKAWRVYYKGGKEVDREFLGSSTYDTENGYIFIDADNDSNAKDYDKEDETKPTKSNNNSSNNSSNNTADNSSNSSSGGTSDNSSGNSSNNSHTSQKPTAAPKHTEPAEKPTNAPVETNPTVQQPTESDEDATV